MTYQSIHIAVISASDDGLVETLAVKPGAHVTAGSPIATLGNPDFDAAISDLTAQIGAARAELRSIADQSDAARLDQVAAVQTAGAERAQAQTQHAIDETLYRQGYMSDLQFKLDTIKLQQLTAGEAVARRKLAVIASQSNALLAVQQAKIDELQGQLVAKQAHRASLDVVAATPGVVQSVGVDIGQRITAGTQIARIADQRDLKAVLQVAEADAHGVTLGLPATIDDGNSTVRGHVVRIDPSAQNGYVAVDVGFDTAAPADARPDLHVDGTIELERLRNVISIARPAGAQDGATLALYRLVGTSGRAERTTVRLGTGSLERVAVLSGLAPGDSVIVSDTTAFNDAPSVTLR